MEAVALALKLNDLGAREESIEDRGRGGDIAEEGTPVLCWSVRSHDGRSVFVAAHEDLEEVLGGAWAKLLHAEVLDDQDIDRGELLDEVLALPQGLGLDEIL